MFWDAEKQEYRAHPDCTCGQAEAWKNGNYRPCYCAFLRPLDAKGNRIPCALTDGLRASYLRNWKPIKSG